MGANADTKIEREIERKIETKVEIKTDAYNFRMAEVADAEQILDIYEYYIRETAITFEVAVPSLEEFRERIEGILSDYPYIVCCMGTEIIGYAYAHRQMSRDAYQWNAELSVYIREGYHHLGIGRKLYEVLIELLKMQNVKNVYAGVTTPNEKSEGLHESFGFSCLGTYHSTGYKCGSWHDVTWFEKTIGCYDSTPAPFRPIGLTDRRKIEEILSDKPKAQ